MVPLLLFLLPGFLADQVCVNTSNANITITMVDSDNNTRTTIVDGRSGHVKCTVGDYTCFAECTFLNGSWFNGSYFCLDVNVMRSPAKDEYSFEYSLNTNCTVYFCKNTTIMPLMCSLDRDSAAQKEIMTLFSLRQSCAQLFRSDHEVQQTFIIVEKGIIHNIMESCQLTPGSSASYNLKGLSLNVVSISDANLTGTNSRIQIEAPQLLPQNKSFVPNILLPVNALRAIPEKKRIICLVSYMEHSQFQQLSPHQFEENQTIASMVIRIELLGDLHLHNLNPTIQMTFRIATQTDKDNGSWSQCVYFDESAFVWENDGCETQYQDNQDDVICNCHHTTPFAVLLIKERIAQVHWVILSYISYIGCGLSAFFTALSLVIYVFSRHHRMDYSISIHVSLSGALFLLNTTFLLTEWGARVEPDWVCVFVAALMHYSLLCCFTWMAIEGLHLYLLLIKVFNTYYKHYLVKLSLAGWGIPGVIVAVSLAVKDFKQFYGVTQMTMADTNQTNPICWITDDSFFYSLNLVYFTLIFVFNSGILVAVASSIYKMKQVYQSNSKLGAEAEGKTWRDPERISASCKSGLTVLGFTCLMGTTWGLAFLGSGYVNYPILYLFCILNSAQGFFIFLWICLSAQKQRKNDREDRMTSTPVKTSGIKSE